MEVGQDTIAPHRKAYRRMDFPNATDCDKIPRSLRYIFFKT